MEAKVHAEWDSIGDVVIHRPGTEMFFGLIEPFAFLFERAFNMDEALHEHRELEHALDSLGARIHRLERLVLKQARDNPESVKKLRDYAKRIVKFEGRSSEIKRARHEFESNLAELGVGTVFHILILRPSIRIDQRKGIRMIFPRVSLDVPLANLVFMRDQQVATDTGLVAGRMSKPQRRMEPTITTTIFQLAGAEIVHTIRAPGTLEGGDFIPAGKFAMIGIGDRTNLNGALQLLQHGLNFEEVAIVHRPGHPLIPGDEPDPMTDMHLDTYLNFPGNDVAVGCEPLLKRAKVEIYKRQSRGHYRKTGKTTNLHEYLEQNRFTIVPITTLEQMCYASNFLCIKNHAILAIDVERVVKSVLRNLEIKVHEDPHRYGALFAQARRDLNELKRRDQFFPHKREFQELSVDVTPLQLQEITGGYGGIRCMTSVLNRKPVN